MKRTLDDRLEESMSVIVQNVRRLIADADYLQFDEPPATAYFLSVIAQEECAKAFLLALVHRRIIPWDQRIRRAVRDHRCKQLLCIVMDYLNPVWVEFRERCDSVVLRHELSGFPAKVADAINILRYEIIGQWHHETGEWNERPDYDKCALDIAEGARDRMKQDALYINISADGRVVQPPTITRDSVLAEMERGNRFCQLLDGFLNRSVNPGLDYGTVEAAFRILFSDAPIEESTYPSGIPGVVIVSRSVPFIPKNFYSPQGEGDRI